MKYARAASATAALALAALWAASVWPKADRSPAAEDAAVQAIAGRALDEVSRQYGAPGALALRDAHAKAHGCARGLFTVDPALAADLRLATFAEPGAKLRAWIRFSNGAFTPGSDAGPDGRGMALKLLGGEGRSEHDVLAIAYPQFFSPDAYDYLDFARAGALTGDGAGMRRYFVQGFNPLAWRLRQGLIAYRLASQEIASPLSIAYHSMTAFRFGPDRAVKFALKPCAAPGVPSSREKTPDYLRRALVDGLARAPACFDLLVQFKTQGMSVDDATQEWSVEASPFRKLGELILPVQKVDTPARDAFCEAVRFTPWRAPPEFEPLGSLNKARKAVYDAISKFRHDHNGVQVPDAALAWEAEGAP